MAAALIMGAPVVYAEKGPSDDREPVKSEQNAFDKVRSLIRTKVEEKKIEIENEREDIQKEAVERKVKVLEARKEIKSEVKNIGIQKSAEKTTAMLNAMVERFEKLIERISSRIEKVNAAGGDTKVSLEKLNLAKADLAKARVQIADLSKIDLSGSTTASTTASTTLKVNFNAYKDAVKAVKNTSKLVHKDLEESVRALKMGGLNEKSTTTPKTTGQ